MRHNTESFVNRKALSVPQQITNPLWGVWGDNSAGKRNWTLLPKGQRPKGEAQEGPNQSLPQWGVQRGNAPLPAGGILPALTSKKENTMRTPAFTRRKFLHQSCLAGAVLGIAGLLPLSAQAAEGDSQTVQETRLLMGTIVTLTASHPARAKAEDAIGRAFVEMDRLIAIFDRFNSASALSVLNTDGALASAPQELLIVLAESQRLGVDTDFAFNPAITPVVDLFSAARAAAGPGKDMPEIDSRALTEALALAQPADILTSNGAIRLQRAGMRLTLDGIAKGYIADAASRVLTEQGVRNHMVNAGGDIRASGFSSSGKPWVIGIENPALTGGVLETVSLTSAGIATSGGYETFYDRARKHHHLISHRTGKSPAIASVTVKAPTAMQADALATALALMPPAEALRYTQSRANISCLIIGNQGQRYASENWG